MYENLGSGILWGASADNRPSIGQYSVEYWSIYSCIGRLLTNVSTDSIIEADELEEKGGCLVSIGGLMLTSLITFLLICIWLYIEKETLDIN